MQCTVHTGNSLGIGVIEKYVGRYWMFNSGATLKTQIHISQLTARQELVLNAREMTSGKEK
jgi:hypothetical protein